MNEKKNLTIDLMETLILSISEDTCQSTPCLGGALAIQDQEECERSLSDLGWSCKNIMTWPSQDLDFVIKNNDFLILLIWYVINFPEFHINTHGSAQQCQSIKFTLTQATGWCRSRVNRRETDLVQGDHWAYWPGYNWPGPRDCALLSQELLHHSLSDPNLQNELSRNPVLSAWHLGHFVVQIIFYTCI